MDFAKELHRFKKSTHDENSKKRGDEMKISDRDVELKVMAINAVENTFVELLNDLHDYDNYTKDYLTLRKIKVAKISDRSLKNTYKMYVEIIEELNLPNEFREKFLIESRGRVDLLLKEGISLRTDELRLLRDRKLLDIITKEFDKKIEGEQENKRSIFLNACGCLVINQNQASFNLCVNSNSGAGKDYVVKNVLKIFPRVWIQSRSRISPTAFTYWHNSKNEPDWTWDGKICYLSDISNSILNSEVFKLMCSDETMSTIVVNHKAVDIEINGKPVIVITTASASPNNEMLRRFPFLELDETTNQTEAIMRRQAQAASKGKTIQYDGAVTRALSRLQRVKVKIPFSKKLCNIFSHEVLINRTHYERFLDYIKASASLHQFQREKDSEGYLIAEPDDYNNARIILKATTSNALMIPLTKKQKQLLLVCEDLRDFPVKDIDLRAPFISKSKIYEELRKLNEYGFLHSYYVPNDRGRDILNYKYKEIDVGNIPTWEELCRNLGNKEIKGNEGIKGNKENTLPISPISPISPPKPTYNNTALDELEDLDVEVEKVE